MRGFIRIKHRSHVSITYQSVKKSGLGCISVALNYSRFCDENVEKRYVSNMVRRQLTLVANSLTAQLYVEEKAWWKGGGGEYIIFGVVPYSRV